MPSVVQTCGDGSGITGGLVVYVCWEDYLGAATDVLCPEAALIGLTVAYTGAVEQRGKSSRQQWRKGRGRAGEEKRCEKQQ